MVKFFKMTSLKVVCILCQALPALIVTEFFQCKFVQNEGFNNLLVKETAVLQLCISDQCVNHLSKNDGNILLKYLLARITFSVKFYLQIYVNCAF